MRLACAWHVLYAQVLTHVVLNGHPIGVETLRLCPWVTYEPRLTLHLDAQVIACFINRYVLMAC